MVLLDRMQSAKWKKFKEVIKLTGIIITKLDSSSKAGFAISTSRDFDLPIKFIGVGEKLEDLVPFDLQTLARHYLNGKY